MIFWRRMPNITAGVTGVGRIGRKHKHLNSLGVKKILANDLIEKELVRNYMVEYVPKNEIFKTQMLLLFIYP